MSFAIIGRGQRNSRRADKQENNFLAVRLRPLILHLSLEQQSGPEQALSGSNTRQISTIFCQGMEVQQAFHI